MNRGNQILPILDSPRGSEQLTGLCYSSLPLCRGFQTAVMAADYKQQAASVPQLAPT